MSYQACKKDLAAIVDSYKKESKTEKIRILDEASRITGLTRKHLVRMMKQSIETLLKRKSAGRSKKFPRSPLIPHVQFLWI